MKFKTDLVEKRFSIMHKMTQAIAVDMDDWLQKKCGEELTLTETVTSLVEDELLKRVSDTHRTGRAFDVRIIDLTEGTIAEFCAHFRRKYRGMGASQNNGEREFIVYKPHGSGPHLHIQLSRKYIKKITLP